MKPPAVHQVRSVFGISRDLPLNYVDRPSADEIFVDSLTRDKHIVIYGSSKQGKTSLRKHCLEDSDYIIVQCSNKWQITELNSAILKAAGFEISESTTKTIGGKAKIIAKVAAKFLGSGGEAGTELEGESKQEKKFRSLELDPNDVNDVIAALESINFSKFVILEDFHYLPIETQKDFSVALKAFHENSNYCFIVIGVWLEENRLTVYNGDLTGRVISINADLWTEEELHSVISKGEELLNIEFHPNFKENLVKGCFNSVSILQEVCYEYCQAKKILHTQETKVIFGEGEDVQALVRSVVNQQSGRFKSFINQFAEGFQATELEMYRWLLKPIIASDTATLEIGFKFTDIRRAIQAGHPKGKDLNPGNITQALQSTASLQVKKDIKPIILDYDQTNSRLNVVDRSFLIWLENQDRSELLELAGLD